MSAHGPSHPTPQPPNSNNKAPLRVLAIRPGFGRLTTAFKAHYGPSFATADVPDRIPACASCPEMASLRSAVAAFRPDVLVSCSRGGAYLNLVLASGAWAGPSVIMCSYGCGRLDAEPFPARVPVLLTYGRRDPTGYDVGRIRARAATGTPGMVRFILTEDGHHPASLVDTGKIFQLIEELVTCGKL